MIRRIGKMNTRKVPGVEKEVNLEELNREFPIKQ